MTLSKLITKVLQQSGLSTTSAPLQDDARDFVSLVLADTMPMVAWWWTNLTTTFATVASTRTYQPVSAQVTAWRSFVDQTNNEPLTISGEDEYDLADLDRSETGSPRAVLLAGLDATTGFPIVELHPTPSAVATIRVRYSEEVVEFTSTNDATAMSILGVPRIMENVLIYGATRDLLDDNGDESGATKYNTKYERSLHMALKQNRLWQGNRSYPPIRNRAEGRNQLFRVGTDTVTAP
jgi:hypothetical protein